MTVDQILASTFTTSEKRNKTLNRMVTNKVFAQKAPSAHAFLASINAQIVGGTFKGSDAQLRALGNTMRKYIPLLVVWNATPAQLDEMNEAQRHAENDAA